MKKFTRRESPSPKSPKDGSPPLTVVEFNLLPDVRKSLMAALKPYVSGEKTNSDGLADIVRNHLPFTEMERFSNTPGLSSYVYVIKGLPEILPRAIPENLWDRKRQEDLRTWLLSHTYGHYIAQGLAAALRLQPPTSYGGQKREAEGVPMVRYRQDGSFSGKGLHKHPCDLNILTGVISDGAPTGFTDWQAMLDEANAPSARVDVWREKVSLAERDVPLADFEKKYSQWKAPQTLYMSPHGVNPDSQNVVIGPGDLVLWANDGHIFHQALPGKETCHNHDMIRALVGWNFDRPQKEL